MTEQINGAHVPEDVEMKEETTEPSVNSVPSAPTFDPEQQQAPTIHEVQQPLTDTSTVSELPAINGQAVVGERESATLEPPVAAVPPPPVPPPGPASPLPPTPSAPVMSHAPPPLSAPTPPSAAAAPPTRPSSIPPTLIAPPEKPNPHGSPTRVYLNQNVTPHLLEGLKYLAAYEPEKPLKWLSEFLAKRSAEMEGA
ncbi:hypothetical protein MBLNU459_g5126t1 [Dothideomycetes sp. NU459]